MLLGRFAANEEGGPGGWLTENESLLSDVGHLDLPHTRKYDLGTCMRPDCCWVDWGALRIRPRRAPAAGAAGPGLKCDAILTECLWSLALATSRVASRRCISVAREPATTVGVVSVGCWRAHCLLGRASKVDRVLSSLVKSVCGVHVAALGDVRPRCDSSLARASACLDAARQHTACHTKQAPRA